MLVIEVFFFPFFKRLVLVGFIIIKKKKKLRKVKSFILIFHDIVIIL